MKVHSNEFKQQIKTLGREIKTIISYDNITLEEELYSVTPHYNANLLKSIMKQLDIVSSVDIPKETIINLQIGIKVNDEFEMLDYGNYVVYSTEKQEDTNTYKIIAYDKMLYSMKEYEELEIQYPISLKNYLIALGNQIGLQVENTTFANEDRQILSDLYVGLNYTYRDILDEISQATGSNIIINSNDRLEVKYFTQTNDIIDEEFLKDINVKFGEKYGAINTIVLSRSAESDNIYYPSPLPENPVEIKIKDNQLMNDNNRADYLPELYQKLNGLEFYLNDFNSTGILYYEPCDIYNVRIGENTYKCVMLNDEINITTGLKEIIFTDMPEQSETDYTKADKTDRRINQTYLIVDKQNQQIESVISNVSEQNNKISQITQTVDEINSKIQDIADITTSAESAYASVSLTDINESEPIELRIHPITTNISYLYPRSNLYPSDTLYMTDRKVRFIRTYEEGGETLTENIDYTLPDDLLYYDANNYDEFYLNYDSQTCQVIKKCKYNADGSVGLLDNTITTDYTYPQILLGEGDYEVKILGYNTGYISVRLMAKNIYTSQFYTKSETDSIISQTASQIDLSVNQKLSNYSTTNEMNSAISLSANNITSTVSQTYATKTELNTAKSEIKQTTDGIESTVSQKVGNNEVISKINQSSEAVTINANKISLAGKQINLTGDNTTITSTNFSVDKNGNMTANNANISGNITSSNANITGGSLKLYGGTLDNPVFEIAAKNDSTTYTRITPDSLNVGSGSTYMSWENGLFNLYNNNSAFRMYESKSAIDAYVRDFYVVSGVVHANAYYYDSLEKLKKNIVPFKKDVLQIIKESDLYEFNYKAENNSNKKHIGFIIGENYRTPKEVIANSKDGINSYTMCSILWKGMQEQQEIIESLEARIKELEEGK